MQQEILRKKENGCWIFLSHSSADIEKIRMIRNEFEACGHNPLAFHLKCLNDSTPEGEEELWNLIYREIDERDWFVFCESQASLTSKNVKKERAYIFQCEKKFIWTLDLSLPDNEIRAEIHRICSQMRIFVSGTYHDLRTLGRDIIQSLISADYDLRTSECLKWGVSLEKQIEEAVSVYGNKGYCLLLITRQYLASSVCVAEMNYLVHSGAKIVAILFDGVEPPSCLGSAKIYRIPHLPQTEDARLIKQMIDDYLRLTINGPIKADARLYDDINELEERLNFTHRYHSMDPIPVKRLGPEEDYATEWMFPCCGKTTRSGNKIPSKERADGCEPR